MIFMLVIFLLLGAVAFFHYLQGFFSATLSAILTVIAAVLAVSYHESLAQMLVGRTMTDSLQAVLLLGLFAVIYLILRVAFDKLVPGNVTLPSTLDKVGAAVMGIVAGVFVMGVLAIAGQELPLGGSIAGYTRYAVNDDRDAVVPTPGHNLQGKIYDQTVSSQFTEGDRTPMWVPVDDIVMGMVRRLSDRGSLAGRQPLVAVHPDFLQELYGQRLGIQPAAKHVVVNKGNKEAVRVEAVYAPGALNLIDHDFKAFRPQGYKFQELMKGSDSHRLIALRVVFSTDAADSDGKVRLSPGAVRLVTEGEGGIFKNSYPLATMGDSQTAYVHRVDDFLYVEPEKPVDFVFDVDTRALNSDGKSAVNRILSNGSFIEVKRMGRVDLGGRALATPGAPGKGGWGILRKQFEWEKPKPGKEDTGSTPPPPPPKSTPPKPAPKVETDPTRLQAKLIGTWNRIDEKNPFNSMQFQTGGALIVSFSLAGQENQETGTWKVVRMDGVKLIISMTTNGKTVQRSISISEDDRNMTISEGSSTYTMVRAG